MKEGLTMKEMAVDERPYEKCEKYGAGSLTDVELLAAILRTGVKGKSAIELARSLLYEDIGANKKVHLQDWTREKLMEHPGIGRVKAIQILCICELSKRMAQQSAREELDFSRPDTIAEYYMEDMRHRKQEHMKLILLNGRSRMIGECELTKGTVNMSLISPRELFIEALQKNAVYIILLHNHPSGDPSPSTDDILTSRRVKEAGALLGIELLDHIIIGDNCYVSFSENNFFEKMA